VRRVFASTSSAPAYSYDPYGNALQGTAPLTDFNYAGMFYNADSGLYLTQYRAYDPVSGRWLSRDPLGEVGQLSPLLNQNSNYNSTNSIVALASSSSAIRAGDTYHPSDTNTGLESLIHIHTGDQESFSLIMIELQEEINLYAYTANNPISYRDTEGLDLADDILKWLGPGAACFRTSAGATMLMSTDRTRIIRFDLNGHGIGPHINIEPGRIHIPLQP
jgi:RHS repeat-associated protein